MHKDERRMLRVKAERLRRRWSQVHLAYWSGLSVADISRIETGRLRPYPGQLAKLASALEVDGGTLLDDVSEDEAHAGTDKGSPSRRQEKRNN